MVTSSRPYRLALLALALGCLAPSVRSAGTPAEQAQIAELVRGLGAEGYREREQAAITLWRIGRPALPALRAAAASNDPEIQTRAAAVVHRIRLGITEAWPAEAVALAESYAGLSPRQRAETCRGIAALVHADAVSFLVTCLDDASDDLARSIGSILGELDAPGVWQTVLEILPEVKTPAQARIRAMAIRETGTPEDLADLLASPHLPGDEKGALCQKALDLLVKAREEKQFKASEPLAGRFCKAVPEEGRFLYLHAEFLEKLEQPDAARELQKRALALNPDKEAPHYTCGEFLLEKLNRSDLSEREWKYILKIEPRGGVYDMNAHLRLATICERRGQFAAAAGYFERVVTAYEKQKKAGGSGFGMVGGSPDSLREKIVELKQRAARTSLTITVEHVMPDDEMLALRRELADAFATMNMSVQPHGFRLFRIEAARLDYDPEQHKLLVKLNNSTCTEEQLKGPLPDAGTRVILVELDCWHVFQVNAQTRAAELVRSFEANYAMTLKLPGFVKELSQVVIRINGEAYAPDALREPIPFDFLPKKLKIEIEGIDPSGKPARSTFELEPRPPRIKPLEKKSNPEDPGTPTPEGGIYALTTGCW